MPSSTYDAKTGKAGVFFRFGGRQYNKTVNLKSARAATALCETIDQTLADLERGRLTLPPGSNAATFIVSGGAVTQSATGGAAAKSTLRLADVFERYRTDSPPQLAFGGISSDVS